MEKYALIVTEKPDAAAKIASALDIDGKPRKFLENGVPYYVATRETKIVVVPALGHLYTVVAEERGRHYPVFDYKWVPLYIAKPAAKYTRAWLGTLAQLSKNADSFIDACDFDIEGSVVGYTILKYTCGGAEKNAKRMKYSTLTKEEIEKSYAEALPQLDFGLIDAGMARHEIDWLYGINLSRALTTSAKKVSGQYATISTGRVQGPTLKFLAVRERSIRKFVPTPYWSVHSKAKIGDRLFEVTCQKSTVENREEAKNVVKSCKGKKGRIEKIEKKRIQKFPLGPFDLSSLQYEAYRLFKYAPDRTLKIAQRLYLEALISYPRTSSQKLPPAIGYAAIIKRLTACKEFEKNAMELLSKPELKPHEGKGIDSAHPAIYPTGNLPERKIDSSERNVWNLVVKRFLAVFGQPSIQQSTRAVIDVNGQKFVLSGEETLEEGWLRLYKPYWRSRNLILPPMEEGQEVIINEINLKNEFTKPPIRYNPASLLRKMQKEEIGTKATRAGIIQTLYERKYVRGERLAVTELGYEVVDVLRKYCPHAISSKLTRKLEKKMEQVHQGKETKNAVIREAIEALKPVTEELKLKEGAIGAQLSQAIKKSILTERTIGSCPICNNGKLVVLHSRKTRKRFIGCTGFFEGNCKAAFPLPQQGLLKSQGSCRGCGWPTMRVLMRRKHPWLLCFNPDCPYRKGRNENQ